MACVLTEISHVEHLAHRDLSLYFVSTNLSVEYTFITLTPFCNTSKSVNKDTLSNDHALAILLSAHLHDFPYIVERISADRPLGPHTTFSCTNSGFCSHVMSLDGNCSSLS